MKKHSLSDSIEQEDHSRHCDPAPPESKRNGHEKTASLFRQASQSRKHIPDAAEFIPTLYIDNLPAFTA